MRILIDECAPARLRQELSGHDVYTVHDLGWSGKKNGELLQLAIGKGLEVLLTVDQNIRYQQNFKTAGIAALVLVAPTNRLTDLLPLMPSARAALASMKPGDVVEITT